MRPRLRTRSTENMFPRSRHRRTDPHRERRMQHSHALLPLFELGRETKLDGVLEEAVVGSTRLVKLRQKIFDLIGIIRHASAHGLEHLVHFRDLVMGYCPCPLKYQCKG